MADAYTLKKLTDVKDSAPAFGYGEFQEARFAGEDLVRATPASRTSASSPTGACRSVTVTRTPRRSTS